MANTLAENARSQQTYNQIIFYLHTYTCICLKPRERECVYTFVYYMRVYMHMLLLFKRNKKRWIKRKWERIQI